MYRRRAVFTWLRMRRKPICLQPTLPVTLYLSTHQISMGYTMYGIAQKAKAAILRNEITGNEILYSAAVPDSLREKQNRLTGNIAAYNNLILEENRKPNPDSSKITLWKDALFEMNREKEKVTDDILKVFPRYRDLIRKTDPVPVQEIRKQLKRDETIVDYLLSNQYIDGKRKLYIFLISRNRLEFREELARFPVPEKCRNYPENCQSIGSSRSTEHQFQSLYGCS